MLVAFAVDAFIHRSIFPGLLALAILQVIRPVSFILRAVNVEIGAVAVGFVTTPFTIEDVSIYMVKDAPSVSLVVLPIAFVAGAIRPSLFAETVTEPSEPLTLVNCSVFKCVLAFLSMLHLFFSVLALLL